MALLLTLEALYVESYRFNHRADYLSIDPATVPEQLPFSSAASLAMSDDGLGALVKLRVHTPDEAKDPPLKYEFDVVLACAFRFSEDTPKNDEERDQVMASGVATLMPFARETIASITSKGRFGLILLPTINMQVVMEQFRNAKQPATAAEKNES